MNINLPYLLKYFTSRVIIKTPSQSSKNTHPLLMLLFEKKIRRAVVLITINEVIEQMKQSSKDNHNES